MKASGIHIVGHMMRLQQMVLRILRCLSLNFVKAGREILRFTGAIVKFFLGVIAEILLRLSFAILGLIIQAGIWFDIIVIFVEIMERTYGKPWG